MKAIALLTQYGRRLQRENCSLQEEIRVLKLELATKRHFEHPAPCDSPWIAKFVVLEKDYQALEKQHYAALDRERAAKQRLQALIFGDRI